MPLRQWYLTVLLQMLVLCIVPYRGLADEIYIKCGTEQKVELGEIGSELMINYGRHTDYYWQQGNDNIIKIRSQKMTECTIYGYHLGETTLKYFGAYIRNNVVGEYTRTFTVYVVEELPPNPDDSNVTWLSNDSYYTTSWYSNNKSEFTLNTAQELAGLSYLVRNGNQFKGKTIKLGSNISLAGKLWWPIGYKQGSSTTLFAGTFNGMGHKISGINIERIEYGQEMFGFFGKIEGATIKNVTFSGHIWAYPRFSDTNIHNIYVGGAAAFATSGCTFEHCTSYIDIRYSKYTRDYGSADEVYCGGLIGYCGGSSNTTYVKNCYHNGNIYCADNPDLTYFYYVAGPEVGGLIGFMLNTKVERCGSYCPSLFAGVPYSSQIRNNMQVGGLVGYGSGYESKVSYSWSIVPDFQLAYHGETRPSWGKVVIAVGGIIGYTGGYSTGSVDHSYSCIGSVYVNVETGVSTIEFSGIGDCTVSNCYQNSDLSFQTLRLQGYEGKGNGNKTYTSQQMKTASFLNVLNNEGDKIWIANDDGYPCINEALFVASEVIPTGFTLLKSTETIICGQTKTLDYTITPEYANAKNLNLSWSSEDTNIVAVSASGVLKGISPGETRIWARTPNGLSASCRVTVPPEPEAVSVSPGELELLRGQSALLDCSFTPSDAATLSVTWESSNPDVAAISQEGVVRALRLGHATLTATTRNGVTGKCELTVPMPLYQLFVWNKAGIKTGYLSTDEPQFNLEGDIVHFSTNHLTMDIHRDTLDKFTLEQVLPYHPKAVMLPSFMSLPLGESEQLSAILKPTNAKTSLTWFSSNPEVVSITQEGRITALQPGKANVLVQTSNGLHATCLVTVPVPHLRFFVWLRNGEIHGYDLEEHPEVTLGKTVFTLTSSRQKMEYQAADILQFSLQDEALIDGVSIPEAIKTDNVQFSEGTLLFSGCPPHSPVQVYDTLGRMVQTTKTDGEGNLTLSLSPLHAGTYIIRTQTTTIKIQKRAYMTKRALKCYPKSLI